MRRWRTATGPTARARRLLLALGWVTACLVLWLARDALSPLLGPVSGQGSGPARGDDLVVAVAALACWLLLCWAALGVAVSAAGLLPGAAGRGAAVVARRTVPDPVRRVVALAAGAGAAAALALPGAASAAPPAAAAAATAAPAQTAVGDVDGDAPAQEQAGRRLAEPGEDLDWPHAPAPGVGSTAPRGEDGGADLGAAAPGAPPTTEQRAAATAETAGGDGVVVVAPGDSLWVLAEEHLEGRHGASTATDAQVAVEWPRWWAANRAVVGDDPDLLHPGQRLVVPATAA